MYVSLFRHVHSIRQNKAAVTLQKHIRGWIKRVQYQKLKHYIIGLQTLGRGLLARQRFQHLKHKHAVSIYLLVSIFIQCLGYVNYIKKQLD